MLNNYLTRLAQPDNAVRRANLYAILDEINAPVQVQRADDIENILVRFHADHQPYILIGAHYDTVPDSPGANQNAAAVAIALGILRVFTFIQARKARPLPLEFAFFDRHDGQRGSRLYADTVEAGAIYAMLDLELCGVGDTVLLTSGPYLRGTPLDRALRRLELSPHQQGVRVVDLLPPGDALPFADRQIPALSACIVPEEDVVPMIGMGLSLRSGETVALLPGVYETIYNPALDTVDTIEINAMRQVMLVVNHLLSNLLKTMPEEDIDWK